MREVPKINMPAVQMAIALNETGKHVYAGTVPHATKVRNRKANKRARKQRKVNAR